MSSAAENRMVEAFRDHPPDYSFGRPRNVQEYGFVGFAKDYALKLGGWIVDNYTEILHTEAAAPRPFGRSYIFRRNGVNRPGDDPE
jgi:hypothetical protein